MAGGLRIRVLTDKKSMAAAKASINRFVASTSRNMQLGMSAAGNSSGAILTGGITDAMKSLTKKMGPIGTAAGLAGGVAIAAGLAIGVKSVKSYAEFEDELVQSQAIMGGITKAMDREMKQQALSMTRISRFAAPELAGAYFYLASAGLDYEQSVKALPATTRFATAGMFDLKQATDLLTDAQSALGLKHKDANENYKQMTRLSDILVRANTLANASVEQFSIALTTKSGAALKVFNFGVEEGVATLAALADQGIKAQRAGDALSISLRNITTTAIKNADEYRKYNIAVFDSQGMTRGLADIIGDLEGALEGKSDEMKKAILLELGFADRAQATLLALLGTSEAIRRYEAELKEAGGTTEEVANKQMSTLAAKTALLGNAVKEMWIRIGAILSPIAEKIVTALTGMFRGISDFINKVSTGFSSGTSSWAVMLRQFASTASSVWSAFTSGIYAIFAPMIAAIKALWSSGFLQVMLDGLAKFITSILYVIQGFADLFAGVFKAFTLVLKGDWSGAWDAMLEGLKSFGSLMLQAFAPIINALLSLVESGMNGLLSAVKAAVNGVIWLINGMIGGFNEIPGVSVGAIQPVGGSGWTVDLSGYRVSSHTGGLGTSGGSTSPYADEWSPYSGNEMFGPGKPGGASPFGRNLTGNPDELAFQFGADYATKGSGIKPWFYHEPDATAGGGSASAVSDELGDAIDSWFGRYDPRTAIEKILDDIAEMETLVEKLKKVNRDTTEVEAAIAVARGEIAKLEQEEVERIRQVEEARARAHEQQEQEYLATWRAAQSEGDRRMAARYKMGDISRDEYLKYLRHFLDIERKDDPHSDYALSLWGEIQRLEKEIADELKDANKKQQKALDEIAQNTGLTKDALLKELRLIELGGITSGPGYKRTLSTRVGTVSANSISDLKNKVRSRAE